jgi:hypothetical protein
LEVGLFVRLNDDSVHDLGPEAYITSRRRPADRAVTIAIAIRQVMMVMNMKIRPWLRRPLFVRSVLAIADCLLSREAAVAVRSTGVIHLRGNHPDDGPISGRGLLLPAPSR